VDETSSDPDPGAEPEGPPPVGAVPTAAPPPAAPPRLDPGVCAVELPEFEGPLDLLLHLVRRH
jgi:hypothetical protein